MVLSGGRGQLVPAAVVPDEQTWTLAGIDPGDLGVEPVFASGSARQLLIARRLPEALVRPAAAFLEGFPDDVTIVQSSFAFAGDAETRELLDMRHSSEDPADQEHDPHAADEHDPHAEHHHDPHAEHQDDPHAGHAGHGGHGAHDHHDMMAIVGEPSADGLVMEPIELRFGPIGTPLPAGIVAEVTLDGDVVAGCKIHALLRGPDLLAPKAWELASLPPAASPSALWHGIAAAELERAVSHTTWLRAFARVLGWPLLVDRATTALKPLLRAKSDREPLAAAEAPLAELAAFVESSRPLRWRTRGHGRISAARARELGLAGPVARASGLTDDARSDDPLYRQLGFEPIVRDEGDAWARTVLRAQEAVAALHLAGRAAQTASADEGLPSPPSPRIVEGPRGPLHAMGGEVHVPGEAGALAAAAATAVGAEWAAAVVTMASFDLSPWRARA